MTLLAIRSFWQEVSSKDISGNPQPFGLVAFDSRPTRGTTCLGIPSPHPTPFQHQKTKVAGPWRNQAKRVFLERTSWGCWKAAPLQALDAVNGVAKVPGQRVERYLVRSLRLNRSRAQMVWPVSLGRPVGMEVSQNFLAWLLAYHCKQILHAPMPKLKTYGGLKVRHGPLQNHVAKGPQDRHGRREDMRRRPWARAVSRYIIGTGR
jgi:hypothetical protein